MSLQVVVTPSETFPDGIAVTPDMLRRAATPVVNVAGGVDASDIPDGSLTSAKWANADFNFASKGLPGSITAPALGAGAVTAPAVTPDAYFYGAATTTGQIVAFVPPVTPAAYAAGQQYFFQADVAAPSGGVQVNVNGLGAVNLVKGGTAAVALSANDYAAGAIVEIMYDGTQFQLLSPQAVTSPQIAGQTKNLTCGNHIYGPATSITRSGTTATFTFTTPATPAFNTGENLFVEGAGIGNYNGSFQVTVTGTSGGNPTVLTYAVSGSPATPTTGVGFALSSHLIDVTADQILLQDANGNGFLASAVSFTVDFNLTVNNTSIPNNALDTGSTAALTWYYLWIIYNGTTVAGLLSLSATAPTLPTGYTRGKALLGAVWSNASKFITPFRQVQQRAEWLVGTIGLAANTAGTGGIWQGVQMSVAGLAPPIARRVFGSMGVSTASVAGAITLASNALGQGAATWAGTGGTLTDNGFYGSAPFEVNVEPAINVIIDALYYRMPDTGAHYQITIAGFSL